MPSEIEELLALQIRCAKLPTPDREYRFHPTRRWRFDFAWPDIGFDGYYFAVEVEGGTWNGGRHTRGAGFESDCEKCAEALILGWRVLRVTGKQIKSGQAIAWIEQVINRSSADAIQP